MEWKHTIARVIGASIIVAFVGSGTAAVATNAFQHTVGSNWHGHSSPEGGGTHVWTDHDTGTNHASADVWPTSDSVCTISSSTIKHVHCTTAVGISQIWGHHSGPDITNHHN
jgi:hypothetical protein